MKKLFIAAAALVICASAYAQEEAQAVETPRYGYKESGFFSTPKVGAYIIAGYKYSDLNPQTFGDGFDCRLIRAYVDGSIFNDFKYRIQFQANGEKPHVKDYYIEWARFREFSVKLGQFKRAFTFENPMNPWDVGVGDFSFLVKMMAGMGDRLGEANMGGRDQGIQIQGDLFPVLNDSYRVLHYQLGLYNGQGINKKDENKQKDLIGTIQVQPIKGLYLGVFGWMGTWNNGTEDLYRERLSYGLKFDRNNWTVRAEYAHAIAREAEQSGKADALYVTAGIPCTNWLKLYLKWDEFRADGTADTSHDMYSACVNFRLHKNLNFQLEYRRHNNRTLPTPGYNELWFLSYIRF